MLTVANNYGLTRYWCVPSGEQGSVSPVIAFLTLFLRCLERKSLYDIIANVIIEQSPHQAKGDRAKKHCKRSKNTPILAYVFCRLLIPTGNSLVIYDKRAC